MEQVFAMIINISNTNRLFWNESRKEWVGPKEVFTVSTDTSLLWDLADNAAEYLPDDIDGMDIDLLEIGELYK